MRIKIQKQTLQFNGFELKLFESWENSINNISLILSNIDAVLDAQFYLFYTFNLLKSSSRLFQVNENLFLIFHEMQGKTICDLMDRSSTAYWLVYDPDCYEGVVDYFPEQIEELCNDGWMDKKYLRAQKLKKIGIDLNQ